MNYGEEIGNFMFGNLFGTPKYFNQKPWDVAMSTRLRKEYEVFEQKVLQDFPNEILQDIYNEGREFEYYIFTRKNILDGPVMFNDN
jgi:hypothetical protein